VRDGHLLIRERDNINERGGEMRESREKGSGGDVIFCSQILRGSSPRSTVLKLF
jgi:hypothetical protein